MLAVEAFREALNQHALTVNIDAVEVDQLEEAEQLLLLLIETVVVLGPVERDELRRHEPLVPFQRLGPLEP